MSYARAGSSPVLGTESEQKSSPVGRRAFFVPANKLDEKFILSEVEGSPRSWALKKPFAFRDVFYLYPFACRLNRLAYLPFNFINSS